MYFKLLGAIFLSLFATAAMSQNVQLYQNGASLTAISNIRLSANAQQGFDTEFRNGNFFGAFVVAPSGAYGWIRDAMSPEAAIESALRTCERFNESSDTVCKLYATLSPVGYVRSNQTTVSQEVTNQIISTMGTDGGAAVSISDDGFWGRSMNHPTRQAAVDASIRTCTETRMADATRSPGDFPCYLVWSED